MLIENNKDTNFGTRKIPPWSIPSPGEFPPIKSPPGKLPSDEFPPGQIPPGKLAPGEFPLGQIPPGKLPPGEPPPVILPGFISV